MEFRLRELRLQGLRYCRELPYGFVYPLLIGTPQLSGGTLRTSYNSVSRLKRGQRVIPIAPGIATENVGNGVIHGIAKFPRPRIVALRNAGDVKIPQIIYSLHDCPNLS